MTGPWSVSVTNPSIYASPDGRFTVVLQSGVREDLYAICARVGRRETGGVLIGCLEEDGSVARITRVTDQPKGSFWGRFHFGRSATGLASLLETVWSEGAHYLGEWHFHPGGEPTASPRDRKTMSRIANDSAYRCPEPLLLIVGQDFGGRAYISISVCPAGESPVPLLPKL